MKNKKNIVLIVDENGVTWKGNYQDHNCNFSSNGKLKQFSDFNLQIAQLILFN